MKTYIRSIHKAFKTNFLTKKIYINFVSNFKNQIGYPDIIRDLQKCIGKKEFIYFDLGAHLGDTVEKFSILSPTKIYAFEANPCISEKLKNRYSNHNSIEIVDQAVSDFDGEADFSLNRNEQTSSLLSATTEYKKSYSKEVELIKKIVVPTIKLDTFIKCKNIDKCIVIKSDIQGAEYKMLVGCQEHLKSHVLAVYCEIQLYNNYSGQSSFQEINSLLDNFGFKIINIYPCMHDLNGYAVQTDVLWLNTKLQ